MSDILSKPVNPLIPMSRSKQSLPEPTLNQSILSQNALRSLPPPEDSITKPTRALPEPPNVPAAAWPFPNPQSKPVEPINKPQDTLPPPLTPINVNPTPQLTPLSKSTDIPPLTSISRVPVIEKISKEENNLSDVPLVVELEGFPKLTAIGDASLQPSLGEPLPSGFIPPPLEMTRKGAGVVEEIPALTIKRRDVHAYLITGFSPEEFTSDIHGIYSMEALATLPGDTLEKKLSNLCLKKLTDWNGNSDSEMVRKLNSGVREALIMKPDRAKELGLVVGVDVVDSADSPAYVCYRLLVVKFKMNDLGKMFSLSVIQ